MNIDKLAADASKLSIPQLQQAMRDGTLPPYVGLPILQQKSQLAKQAQAAQAAGQPRPPTVAQQVDGEASQAQSVQDMMKQRALAMQGEMAGTGGLGSFVKEPEKKMALGGAVAFAEGRKVDIQNPNDPYGYGRRYNSEDYKGQGYLGPLVRPDGSVMSEYSLSSPINGKMTEYPSIVPTLSPDEIKAILKSKEGEKLPRSVYDKAEAHAAKRIAEGKHPFASEKDLEYARGGAVAFSGENYSYVDPAIIKKYLTEAARKYNLNPDQLIAQANAESSLNPMATNPNSTAAGMGQFTEGTWKDWGTSNPNDRFDPKLAAEAMAKYNRANIDKWGGDLQKGYASYHLGPNADPEKLANDTAYTNKILGQNAPDGLSVPQLTYSQPTKLTDYASQMEISPAGNPEEERAAIEKYLGPNKGIESLRNEISKMREESAADKDKSLGMALMNFGLKMMAKPSPFALVNAGAAGEEALSGYTDSLKEYKKEQSKLAELQARADDADRQEAWNKFKYGEESAKAKTATHRADTLAKQTAQQKTEADQAKLNLETKKSDIDAYTAQSTNAYHQGIINTRGGETNLSDYEGFKNTLLANPQSSPELFKTVDGKLVLDEIKAHNAFTNRKSNIQLSDLNTLMQNINDPNDPLYRAAYEQAQGIVGSPSQGMGSDLQSAAAAELKRRGLK